MAHFAADPLLAPLFVPYNTETMFITSKEIALAWINKYKTNTKSVENILLFELFPHLGLTTPAVVLAQLYFMAIKMAAVHRPTLATTLLPNGLKVPEH